MGIDITLFAKLSQLSLRYKPSGRSVMLGRQGLQINPNNRLRFNRLLRNAGHDLRYSDVVQADGFAEKMWETLGFPAMESMDVADYEGASILHDLNLPVPESLHGQFDFIFDGGTIEHVFDVSTALINVFRMLRPGGRFISANGMNGWVGHGMYQFNPEMVWSFWKRRCGCNVVLCEGLPKDEGGAEIAFKDIADYGTRVRLNRAFPQGRVYLYYEVEKPESAALGNVVQQSDYVHKYNEHAEVAANLTGQAGAATDKRIEKQVWRAAKQAGKST
ncbi:MAG: methyltransferase domain-containing protein [Paracoccaceae bacterium]